MRKMYQEIHIIKNELKKIDPFKYIKNNNLRSYSITFSISVILYLILFIVLQIVPFGNNTICTNDGVAQYMCFISDLYNKVKSGDSLFYSFDGALGFNMFGTIAYYLLSPFTLLIFLFKVEHITTAVSLIIILKMATIAVTMNYYLLHRFKQKNYWYSILFSLAYSFSYYFMAYSYNFMWLDCIMVLPIILRGLEQINTRKGKIQYSISLAYCMITNFYIAGLICIFLFLYYFLIVDSKTIRDWIKNTFSFSLFSILAAMLASFLLIPMGINFLSGSSGVFSFPNFEFFNNLTYVFQRHLPFIEVQRLSSNRGDVNLFPTVAILLLAVMYIFNKSIPLRRKIGTLVLEGFLLFSFTNSWLNFLMHGLYLQRQIPNRYAFMYIFLIVVTAYETITTIKSVNKRGIILSSLILLVILIACYFDYDYSSMDSLRLTLTIIGIIYFIILLFGYSLIFIKNKNFNFFKIFLFIEIALCLTEIQFTDLGYSYTDSTSYVSALQNDAGFYREEVLSTDVTNAATMYGAKGITTFNSVINEETASILGQMGFSNGSNYYNYLGHTPLTDSLFGVKYLYSKYSEWLPANWEYVDCINDINIYKNNFILPIGYSIDTSSFITNYANKFDNLNNLAIDYGTLFRGLSILTDYKAEGCIVNKKDNSNFEVKCNNIGDKITITLAPKEEKNVYLYTKIDSECNLTIYKNNRIIVSTSHSGFISYLGDLSKDDTIKICYTIRKTGDKKLTVFMSSMNEDIFEAFYYDTLDHSLKNQKIISNTIEGTFTAEENNTQIMFTIPYDKGWRVYVDGNKVNLESINNAFCAVTVSEGEHNIKLEYIPEGFEIGTAITCLGLIILGVYYISSKKNIRTEKHTYKKLKSL